MDYILDLDLDFFVSPIAYNQTGKQRLPSNKYATSSQETVREFLEQHCNLDKSRPIMGSQFVEHEDAFKVWRRWLQQDKLSSPFSIFHVDAHSDLGINRKYIEVELLAKPIERRHRVRFDKAALDSSNYLLGAVANRWVSQLTYVYPRGDHATEPGDLYSWCFRNENPKTGFLELKRYTAEGYKSGAQSPIHVEPSVPFHLVPEGEFTFSYFTHMVVAQSPQYTPESADCLLPSSANILRKSSALPNS
jgi:hypothetical protein